MPPKKRSSAKKKAKPAAEKPSPTDLPWTGLCVCISDCNVIMLVSRLQKFVQVGSHQLPACLGN